METSAATFTCPRCRASFELDSNYCGRCGAPMHPSVERLRDLDLGSGDERDRRRTTTDAWLGKLVDGRYRVLERIGQGGMGAVYKVEHQRIGKIAAMKVLHRELADDEEVVRRFRREAEAVSRLTHPNTVQVFDFGVTEGALYLIMEYVRGRDLGTVIRRDGPIPFDRAAPLLCQVCAALAEAHELGIVHRDLKPENVLVTRTHEGTDFAKVLDFGLAKLSEREDMAEASGAGAIIGTPFYMAPEQIRGDAVDGRADIYALGGLLYRALTGEHPFAARSPVGVLTLHLTADLVPPSRRRPDLDIPAAVDAIVTRAMAKRVEDRFASVDELREELEEAYVEQTGSSMPGPATAAHAHVRARTGAQRGATAAPGFPVDLGESGAGLPRLNRADLDAYERSLRRRLVVRTAAIPMVIAGLAAGGYALWVWRARQAHDREQEPNDEPAQATLIAAGGSVEGHLGRRLGPREPDRDFYRVREAPRSDGTQRATVTLSALPNIDLSLALYDPSGALVADADAGGIGHGEWVRRVRADRPLLVAVTQSDRDRQSGLPTENVSDAYRLTVVIEDAAAAAREIEPDDGAGDAMPIGADVPVSARVDRDGDADSFVFDGEEGLYRVELRAPAELPVVLRREEGAPIGERTAVFRMRRGDVLRVELGGPLPAGAVGSGYELAVTAAP